MGIDEYIAAIVIATASVWAFTGWAMAAGSVLSDWLRELSEDHDAPLRRDV